MFFRKKKDNLRTFVRLKSVFPVEFNFKDDDKNSAGAKSWYQGYTQNISEGGFCLETSFISNYIADKIKGKKQPMNVRIDLPLSKPVVEATADIAWVKHNKSGNRLKYKIGLKFDSISKTDLKRIVCHARIFRYSVRSLAVVSLVLFAIILSIGFYNYKLQKVNSVLVNQFVESHILEEKAKKELRVLLDSQLKILDETTINIKDDQDLDNLNKKFVEIVSQENKIAERLELLKRGRSDFQQTIVNKMFKWLKDHQHPSTGLVLSYEGDVDIIKDWAFIYDQALASMVFLISEDRESAKQIINFFERRSKKDFQGFANAYYYDSGKVAEPIVHCGPNIWMGIAVAQYVDFTKDTYYIPLIKKIGDWLISIQDKDPCGGLKGGPDFYWFATEHNLDAYAFYGMIYKLTNEEKYLTAQNKVLAWLVKYAIRPDGTDYKGPPIQRGKGDATIATDTFAWSIAALGPEKLYELKMDPEQVMMFAESNCKVKALFKRPSGILIEAEGFDFSKAANLPRGGLISPEWTSQVIVTFNILSKYFQDKGNLVKKELYKQKEIYYLKELSKLIITSNSPRGQGQGCLPYATLENVDTGHGWKTPNGASTCSVAGTAYMLMAAKQFNPLMLQ